MRRLLIPALLVLMLTVLTQIGGVIYLIARQVPVIYGLRGAFRSLSTLSAFTIMYTATTIWLVPPLAAVAGRVPLPCGGAILRAIPPVCMLNRHYVAPEVAALAHALSSAIDMRFPGTTTLALDGNLPFLDGFPLLPHLSHNDGLKLDLAFYYAESDGTYLPGVSRSPIGYWAFEIQPGNSPPDCPPTWLTARWDMSVLQSIFPEMPIEPLRTTAALRWLVETGPQYGLQRVFLEPYLVQRLGIESELIGFQGCRAARHDDHIHLQILGNQ